VLTETSNNIMKKPKPKTKSKSTLESVPYDSFILTDDSIIEDDDENDPDWRKTPLYNRIQKLEVCFLFFIFNFNIIT
jgi:hypothetical protein